MIEWLRNADKAPQIALAGRTLPIELHRHPTAKRLILRVAPDGSAVRITLPRWCRSADAVAFAEARKDWLAGQLEKVPQRRDPVAERRITYRGSGLPVHWQENAARTARLKEDGLHLGGPEETLGNRLQRWLEREAAKFFEDDAAFFCARAGVPSASVRLTRARRRWGSCSTKGVLRLNWRLVQAPDAVRRSVVAHEVAHLVHFDHSPAFHALLGSVYDEDLDRADAWLSQHGRSLYASFG